MRIVVLWLVSAVACLACAAEDRRVTITSLPRFEQRADFTYLMLTGEFENYKLTWRIGTNQPYAPVTLATNRVYKFTLRLRRLFDGTFGLPKILSIQDGEQTILDLSICEVHRVRMEYKEVPIHYGLMARFPSDPPQEIERTLFPHQREFAAGGCIVGADSPKTGRVYVCSECSKAAEKWRKENRRKE